MRRPTVTLDDVGCCAMVHAFLRHPEHVREWSRISGRLRVLYEIFGNTYSLSFTPNDETAAVYCAFARAETARLKRTSKDRLLCRHGAQRHIASLEKIQAMLPHHRAH